jgi:amidase
MLRRPDRSAIADYAQRGGLTLNSLEIEEFESIANELMAGIEAFDREPEAVEEPVEAVRVSGRKPTALEDPYNAVVRWCKVKGGGAGILQGKRIGIKDSMAIAGVPMTCGSRLLQDYYPRTDSVLVERLLRAGAEIVAVLNMDAFAFSGGGETSDYGAALNPVDTTRTAGGSSGGSAAALYYDGIDITFGTDQGGSIRLPAAWCGVIGLKPTFGLVPYSGIASLDQTFDHVGPMARRVADVALALEAVAGPDARDPRQIGLQSFGGYVRAVEEAPDKLNGITVGVVEEGMSGEAGVEDVTREATLAVIAKLAALGATIREISIPEHRLGLGFPLFLEGYMATFRGFGNGYGWSGSYAPDLARALGKALRVGADELPDSVKVAIILGGYLSDRYYSTLYAKAQNVRPILRSAYDHAFQDVDVLVMPSATVRAHKKLDASIRERVLRGWSMLGNTTPFNMTGHPSLSIPAGEGHGLPVGVMLTGRPFADGKLLSIARTYERDQGWFPAVPDKAA